MRADLDPRFVRASRRRDLLLTLVMVGIGLTPAWLTPAWIAIPWLIAGVVFGLPAVVLSWRYAPWVPTPEPDLSRIIDHLDLEPHQTFCDLGSGDGRVLVRVAAETGARCTGVEGSTLPYLVSWIRLAFQGGGRTSLRFGNLEQVDLSGFDVLYVWGTAYWVATPEFSRQMQVALRPGARLVSYHHPLWGMDPLIVDDRGLRPIHVYVMPSPVESHAAR